MNVKNIKLFILLLFVLVISFLISGCVSSGGKAVKKDVVFFPPPPDLPRYQFLRGFSGVDDYNVEKSQLDSFLGGQQAGYRLKKPASVIMKNKSMYVVDTMSSVWKFDLEKKKTSKIVGDQGRGKLVQPVEASRGANGEMFVADPVRLAILQYDKNDVFVKSYGSTTPWKPVASVEYEGMLYVVDSTHHKGNIKVFSLKTGEIVDSFGQEGSDEQRLNIPVNITVDRDGYLYVMDMGRFQIVKFDRDGHYRGYLGGPGDTPGFFGRPKGLAVDRDGRVYAVDSAYDIVQVFSASGQVLALLGGPGTTDGTLTLPSGVFIDYDNVEMFQEYAAPGFEIEYLVFVTSQFHDTHGISVYGYGKMSGERYKTDAELLEEKLEAIRRGEGR